MASMWRKAMLYLGLGPDDEYDDFDVPGEHSRPVAPRPVARPSGDAQHDPEPSGSVRTLSPAAPSDDHGANGHSAGNGSTAARGEAGSGGSERRLSSARAGAATATAGERSGRTRSAVVRPLPVAGSSKPVVVGPASFNDAQEVADKFKV